MHPEPVEPPEIMLLGDCVVIRGQAAAEAYRLLAAGVQQVERRDGITASGRVNYLLGTCKRAAQMSVCGVADVRNPGFQAESSHLEIGVRVGTREAAVELKISEEHVRRLASILDGRKLRGRWTYDSVLVEAEAERRRGSQ